MLTTALPFRPRSSGVVAVLVAAGALVGLDALDCSSCPPAEAVDSYVSLEGKLLVADPQMPDETFRGTVIYMLAHDEDGAVGVVLNRPLSDEPLEDAPAHDSALYIGGPVGTEMMTVLHSSEWRHDSTRVLAPGLALTPDPAVIHAIDEDRGPRGHRLFVGYAGWGPMQLERELGWGVWQIKDARLADVFSDDPRGLYDAALAR